MNGIGSKFIIPFIKKILTLGAITKIFFYIIIIRPFGSFPFFLVDLNIQYS